MLDLIQNLDWTILDWLQDILRCAFLDDIMPAITMLGNYGWIWFVTAVFLCCTRKYRYQGLILVAALLLGFIIGNLCLKNIIARPRPCWLNQNVVLLIANPGDYSFPSGHTLSSAIAVTVLLLTNRKFGFAALIPAFLIAFSRLYLYVHFPSDVIAAVLLGILIGCLTFRVVNSLSANNIKKFVHK